jgi:hypothetical protein
MENKMKQSILVLAVSFMAASAAFAADLSLEQNSADLGACDGVAKLVKTANGKAEIRIKGVRRCSNLTLQMKLDRNAQGEYAVTIPMELGKDADVQLASNSGTTSTHLNVTTAEIETAPELFSGAARDLQNCQGLVRFSAGYSSPATVVFQNVKNCNRFTVVSVNGRPFDYQKKLQDQGQTWGGSFTLPAAAMQYGRNRVKVTLEGPMNKDSFVLVFDSYQH